MLGFFNMASSRSHRKTNIVDLQKEQDNGKELVEMAEKGDFPGVQQLLMRGVSVNADEYNRYLFYKSQNYMTPLQCAACHGHDDLVQYLITQEADLDAKDRFDVTAVHMAAERGHVKCLKLLLDAGASCNVGTKYSKRGAWTAVPHVGGTTPLHLASKNNHVACVEELILNGADYNAVDEQGRTSLYIAAELGHSDVVLKHLRNAIGRDILSIPVKHTGETPLHECVRQAMFPCVKELLFHGSDVNHRNVGGFSPLHLALQSTDNFISDATCLQYCKELVINGYNADVNYPDRTGATPLHYVCFSTNKLKRRPQVAAFLIAYGAKFETIKNKHGCTVLQQELRNRCPDRIILEAIVNSVVKVPSLVSAGIHTGRMMPTNPKLEWYGIIASTPRTLQHHCRCVVRDALGVMRLKYTRDLPLPETLKDFLLLDIDDGPRPINAAE